METVIAQKVDETLLFIDAKKSILWELRDYFSFRPKGYQFVPAYRNRLWDGYVKLFNMMNYTLPLGLWKYLEKFCEDRGYNLVIDPQILPQENLVSDKDIEDFISGLSLPYDIYDHQKVAIKHAICHGKSLLLSPTGSGKSLIIYSLMRWYNTKTLIIIPTLSLMHQMENDIHSYAKNENYSPDIHLIHSKTSKDNTKDIIISTWQSIYKKPKSWFSQFGLVIIDEAHLAKADSLTKILNKCTEIPFKFGTTGTLDGEKVHKLVLEGNIGPVFQVTKTKDLQDQNILSELSIRCIHLKYDQEECKLVKKMNYQGEIDHIVSNEKRNLFIAGLVSKLPENTLVLFQYVEKHGKVLYDIVKKVCKDRNVYFVSGETDALERERIRKAVDKDKGAIIVASSGVFSTGINIKNLENIIFVSPSKSRIKTLQSIGRVLRVGDTDKATLYDIVDDYSYKSYKNFALKHFIERVKIYEMESFQYKIYTTSLK